MVARKSVEASTDQPMPFDTEFQVSLLRLILDDPLFCIAIAPHLRPHHFESQPLGWIYSVIYRYQNEYHTAPSFTLLIHEARRILDAANAAVMSSVIERIRVAQVRDADWLRDASIDFIKRNIFVRTFHESRDLYNGGQIEKAYDHMARRMEELQRTSWETRDRGWFYDELEFRERQRTHLHTTEEGIPTGFPWLDKIFDGGLKRGELATWIAYPKIGKTTMLIQHGRAAAGVALKNVLHVVLEGSRRLVENRYDACWMAEIYGRVKHGTVDIESYQRAQRDYDFLRGKMVVEGFTSQWDYHVGHIEDTLRDLWQTRNWRPELVIIDYGDLLNARHRARSDYENQKAAFRDMKSLANRGYAIWTAAAAQRPRDGADYEEHLIKSRQVADCYDKVRVGDFFGSLNQTEDEKRAGVMRVYAEMYRENAADQVLLVRADMARMRIYEEAGIVSPSAPTTPTTPELGAPRQLRAVV
jgi:replicative DNA helicase